MRIDGEELNQLGSQHFYRCNACGQLVDKRRLGDVFHHEEDGHAPIPLDG